jgi:hypothetical protein
LEDPIGFQIVWKTPNGTIRIAEHPTRHLKDSTVSRFIVIGRLQIELIPTASDFHDSAFPTGQDD